MSAQTGSLQAIDNLDLVRAILFFCSRDGEIFKSATRLQKLVFLSQYKYVEEFEKVCEAGLFSDQKITFSANHFGPYSRELKGILDQLENDGEIKLTGPVNSKSYVLELSLMVKIREKLKTFENPKVRTWLVKVVAMGFLPVDQLLAHIYNDKAFNEYIAKSKIRMKFENQ